MKKLTTLCTLGATALQTGAALAEDKLGLHYLSYEEGDGRVEVDDFSLSFETDLSVDHTLQGAVGYDSISGASPAWQVATPAVSSAQAASRAARVRAAQQVTDEILLAYVPDVNTGYEVRRVPLTDERKSLDLSWVSRDAQRNETTLGINYSEESDYRSIGLNAQYLQYADASKNRSYNYGLSLLHNISDVFGTLYTDAGSEDLQIIAAEIGLSQIINASAYASFNAYVNVETGYLSNHYLTILREYDMNADGDIDADEVFMATDSRPDQRLGGGFNLSYVRALGDQLALHGAYRFYTDDWDVISHTASFELNWQVAAALALYGKFRYYNQTQAYFYKDPDDRADNRFAIIGVGSADERLGKYTAGTVEFGAACKVAPRGYVELGAAVYEQSNGFDSLSLTLGYTQKF